MEDPVGSTRLEISGPSTTSASHSPMYFSSFGLDLVSFLLAS